MPDNLRFGTSFDLGEKDGTVWINRRLGDTEDKVSASTEEIDFGVEINDETGQGCVTFRISAFRVRDPESEHSVSAVLEAFLPWEDIERLRNYLGYLLSQRELF